MYEMTTGWAASSTVTLSSCLCCLLQKHLSVWASTQVLSTDTPRCKKVYLYVKSVCKVLHPKMQSIVMFRDENVVGEG